VAITVGAMLLIGAVVFFILQPVLSGIRAPMERDEDELTEVEARRRVTLLALRDVEYDFHSGKLDESDYRSLKRELSAEALSAMEEEERELVAPTSDEALEAEIRAVRRGLEEGTTCPDCGHLNATGSRFCASCGSALEPGGGGSGSTPEPAGSADRSRPPT